MRIASVKVDRGFARLRDGAENEFSFPANHPNWRPLLSRLKAGDGVELKTSYACYAPTFRREVAEVEFSEKEITVRLTARPAWFIRNPRPPSSAIAALLARAEA